MPSKTRGGSSRDRRRQRRASSRIAVAPIVADASDLELPVEESVETPAALDARAMLAEVTAAFAEGDVVWGAEEGFQDLICDLQELLNPPGGYRYWVNDVSLDLTRCVVCDCDDGYCYYVAPFTMAGNEPEAIAPAAEWVKVENALVESDEMAAHWANRLDFARIHAAKAPAHVKLQFADLRIVPDPLRADADITPPPDGASDGLVHWEATLVLEQVLTEDGRAFAPGSVTWRDLPLTLMAMTKTADGHDGAEIAGRIENVYRAGNRIMGAGVFDTGEFGSEIARLVSDQTLSGVSVDIAVQSYIVANKAEYFDADGNWVGGDGPVEQPEGEGPSLLDLLFGEAEETIYLVTDGVIGMTTVCPFPAFADAEIAVAASLVASPSPAVWTFTHQAGFTMTRKPAPVVAAVEKPGESLPASTVTLTFPDGQIVHLNGVTIADGSPTTAAAITAAATDAPVKPPAEWFADPGFDELTPITVTDEGRVYGHAAAWETCHLGFADTCVTPPRSNTGYAYFLLKEVECDDGARLPVGTITLHTGHADLRANRQKATEHYDHTGFAVADVTCGEDEHGIWFSGALRPNMGEERIRELRGAVISGDWRDADGNREMIAMLGVNVPGFPVVRPQAALIASGEGDDQVVALIAAGLHHLPGITAEDVEKIEALHHVAAGTFAALAARAQG